MHQLARLTSGGQCWSRPVETHHQPQAAEVAQLALRSALGQSTTTTTTTTLVHRRVVQWRAVGMRGVRHGERNARGQWQTRRAYTCRQHMRRTTATCSGCRRYACTPTAMGMGTGMGMGMGMDMGTGGLQRYHTTSGNHSLRARTWTWRRQPQWLPSCRCRGGVSGVVGVVGVAGVAGVAPQAKVQGGPPSSWLAWLTEAAPWAALPPGHTPVVAAHRQPPPPPPLNFTERMLSRCRHSRVCAPHAGGPRLLPGQQQAAAHVAVAATRHRSAPHGLQASPRLHVHAGRTRSHTTLQLLVLLQLRRGPRHHWHSTSYGEHPRVA